jgi:hypothetical protein
MGLCGGAGPHADSAAVFGPRALLGIPICFNYKHTLHQRTRAVDPPRLLSPSVKK